MPRHSKESKNKSGGISLFDEYGIPSNTVEVVRPSESSFLKVQKHKSIEFRPALSTMPKSFLAGSSEQVGGIENGSTWQSKSLMKEHQSVSQRANLLATRANEVTAKRRVKALARVGQQFHSIGGAQEQQQPSRAYAGDDQGCNIYFAEQGQILIFKRIPRPDWVISGIEQNTEKTAGYIEMEGRPSIASMSGWTSRKGNDELLKNEFWTEKLAELRRKRPEATVVITKAPCHNCDNFRIALGEITGIRFEFLTADIPFAQTEVRKKSNGARDIALVGSRMSREPVEPNIIRLRGNRQILMDYEPAEDGKVVKKYVGAKRKQAPLDELPTRKKTKKLKNDQKIKSSGLFIPVYQKVIAAPIPVKPQPIALPPRTTPKPPRPLPKDKLSPRKPFIPQLKIPEVSSTSSRNPLLSSPLPLVKDFLQTPASLLQEIPPQIHRPPEKTAYGSVSDSSTPDSQDKLQTNLVAKKKVVPHAPRDFGGKSFAAPASLKHKAPSSPMPQYFSENPSNLNPLKENRPSVPFKPVTPIAPNEAGSCGHQDQLKTVPAIKRSLKNQPSRKIPDKRRNFYTDEMGFLSSSLAPTNNRLSLPTLACRGNVISNATSSKASSRETHAIPAESPSTPSRDNQRKATADPVAADIKSSPGKRQERDIQASSGKLSSPSRPVTPPPKTTGLLTPGPSPQSLRKLETYRYTPRNFMNLLSPSGLKKNLRTFRIFSEK